MYEDEPPNPADQQLIKWAKVMMICSGLWNGPIGTHRMVEKLHKIYGRFIRYSFFALVLFLHLECLRLVVKGYNREIVIGSFSVVVSVTKILFKTVVFMRYPLLDVVNEIVRKERQVWASGCEEIQALYRKKIKFVKRTVLMLLVLSTITVMTLQVSGAVATLKIKRYNVMNNASLESHFMYQTVFPLNRINHLNWLFSTEILWGWIGLLYSSITQLIFITILAYAAIQLQILQVHFRDLMGSTVELFPAHAEVLQGALKLREHMVTHKIIIRFINQFNQTTKYMIMMDFLFSSLDIASVSLSISQMGVGQASWLIFYFLTLLTQLIMVAWSCNEIKIQSEALGDALFQSRWYLLDQQSKQNVLFMIRRIGKPLYMTIGGFGPMTTNSIILVLKAAYSYVNLMNN